MSGHRLVTHASALLLPAVLVLVAGMPALARSPSPAAPAASPDAPPSDLLGTWVVTGMDSGSGTAEAVSVPASLRFGADLALTGNGGCHPFSAPYQAQADSIAIGPLDTPPMDCPDPTMTAQESDLYGSLVLVRTWAVTPDGLVLGDPASGRRILASRTADSAVVGDWTVQTLYSQAGIASDPNPQGIPTVSFQADGTVTGSTGCLDYVAAYAVNGSRLGIGQVDLPEVACDATLSVQESTFLWALETAHGWQRSADSLTLDDGAGDPVLQLGAAAP